MVRAVKAVALLTGIALVFAAEVRIRTAVTGTDVVTYHNDAARTGQNLNETFLTTSTVSVSTFGKIEFFPADGKVDAQPLYLSGVAIPGQGTHNVLYVATEHDSVYGFDADTGAVLWRVSMLGAGEATGDGHGCSQVIPEIGVTSTPVIDRSRGPNGAIYVVAMSKNGSGTYFQRLHALDVTSGAELFGGPKDVQATFPGTGAGSSGGTLSFDSKQYEERAGLLLLNGMIITAWTSHCDGDPYTGWIMSYDQSTLAQTSVLNVTPNGSRGAFWMAGAGPAADSAGNIYLLDGNGTFDTSLDGNGFPRHGNFGNAFLKVSTSAGLAVADYFATFNTVQQSNADLDLGSGGTLVLPDLVDSTGQVRHLAVGAGKDAHIYVVDRDSMGKWNASSNQIYQDITGALGGAVYSMPAYFDGSLYYGAAGNALKAFSISNARLSSTPASKSGRMFPYPGTTPGISASGTTNAILWAVENANPAVLHAYDARDLSHELYNSNQAAAGRDAFGPGNKFITPTIVNGRVYVGTTNGVAAFGSLGPAPIVVTGIASGITPTGATLNGTANPVGAETTASFQYGLTADYGSTTPAQSLGSGTAAVAIGGGSITGLASCTLYHFRAVATNSTGTTNGVDGTFTTAGCPPPMVVTGNASGIGPRTATLNGTANPNGTSTNANFEYGVTTSYGRTTPAMSLGSGFASASIGGGSVTGLTCNTLYHFHAVATNSGGTMSGSDATFMTAVCPSATVVWRNKATGQDIVWLMNGVSIANSAFLPTIADTNWEIKAIGDLVGDASAGLVWRDKVTGQDIVCLMNGTTITSSAFLPTIADLNWGMTGLGDVRGNGQADLFWRNASSGQNIVWLMNGTTITSSAFLPTISDTNWAIKGVGDFNGDGTSGVIWRNASTGQNMVWLMNVVSIANSAFLPTIADPNWEIKGAGDFDGDGKADVFWRNKSTGQNIVWLMNGVSIANSGFLPTIADTNWEIKGVVDLDGDGRADVIWRNKATGQNIVWLMNGLTIQAAAFLPTIADLNWEIVGR